MYNVKLCFGLLCNALKVNFRCGAQELWEKEALLFCGY